MHLNIIFRYIFHLKKQAKETQLPSYMIQTSLVNNTSFSMFCIHQDSEVDSLPEVAEEVGHFIIPVPSYPGPKHTK